MPRVIVQSRSLFDDGVNVGDGHHNPGSPIGQSVGNGKLIQVPRIIIVDGAPEKVAEITRGAIRCSRWPVDSIKLGQRLGREIRDKSFFPHGLIGNSTQDRAVLIIVWIYHLMCPLVWNAECGSSLDRSILLGTAIIPPILRTRGGLLI